MPSPSSAAGATRWRKRPIKSNPTTNRSNLSHEDSDNEDDETQNAVGSDDDEDLHPNPNPNLNQNQQNQHNQSHTQLRIQKNQNTQLKIHQTLLGNRRGLGFGGEGEVIGDAGERISEFPAVVRRAVRRHHSYVMGIVGMERAGENGDRERQVGLMSSGGGNGVVLENVSYGQLQAMSAVPVGMAVWSGDQESGAGSSCVLKPPGIMEGKGVGKKFGNGRVHVVPMHADWFSPTTVHRTERQVVPHFFSGKSTDHTPERYLDCRNAIVAKYMENPEKRICINDCQGLAVGVSNEDLKRIFRFLDHWGIINYCAPKPDRESWNVDSYLREDPSGEVQVPSASLKSIDSLVKFDKPKCRLKSSEVCSSISSSGADDMPDLDYQIWERFSENCCSYCSQPLLIVYYQSIKEAESLLCADCYHEGRCIVGHSSIDFTRVDSIKDYSDLDGENWTDEETLLLLQAVELYTDNWNEIADHVGSKSKAQCILHFLRLPVEDGLLETVDVPTRSLTSDSSHIVHHEGSYLNSNGEAAGHSNHGCRSESRLPFEDSENPVMSLVSLLASAVGPRVAAACAHASLAALSEDDRVSASGSINQMDELVGSNRVNSSDGLHGEVGNSISQRGDMSTQGSRGLNNTEVHILSPEKVKSAAKAGLSAAAIKAKLFADHEEREIQRLAANIINHQLKRLELKLKQFAEVETLLMKECEQVEKARQRFAAERSRLAAPRFGTAGSASSAAVPPALVYNNIGNRQPIISTSPSQPSIPGYGNIQLNHPNMPLMARQQMFGFGQRLPLSAIQPPASGQSANAMFNAQGSGQSSMSNPMLRTIPGASSGLG
ncbi:SWI/SNF complex subunit SWI3C-like protein [Drosera capensis]